METKRPGKWMKPTPPTPALTDAERAAPLDTWAEQETRRTAERVARMAADRARAEHEGEARLARARAWKCDDGTGACLYCSVPLGTDDTGAQTHPDNGCPGPGRTCTVCGKVWDHDGKRWNPTCTAEEHEARDRSATWALATRTHNPLVAPPRVYKDED